MNKKYQLENAYNVLYELKDNNIEPDIIVFSNLLRGYAKSGDVHTATQLLNQAKNTGLPLKRHLYEPLIEAYTHMCDNDNVRMLKQDMRKNGASW